MLVGLARDEKMVTIAEQPCYTLIHTFDDSSEVPNEQQLKHDLGK